MEQDMTIRDERPEESHHPLVDDDGHRTTYLPHTPVGERKLSTTCSVPMWEDGERIVQA